MRDFWRAVIIIMLIALGLMLLAVLFTRVEAEAAPGQTCLTKHYSLRITAGPVTTGRFKMNATGCYWNDNSGVASLTVGTSGYANAPYRYRGVIGEWTDGTACPRHRTCTHRNNHLVIIGRQAEFEFCLPAVGCQTTASPSIEAVFDSYGHLSFRWF